MEKRSALRPLRLDLSFLIAVAWLTMIKDHTR